MRLTKQEKRVLATVREFGPCPRLNIAVKTGLGLGAVAGLLTDLEKNGLIISYKGKDNKTVFYDTL